MKLPRPIGLLSAIAIVVLACLVCGALLLPRLINSRLNKDTISSELAKKTAGNVTFGRILFLWFPRPHVLIEDATKLRPEDNDPRKRTGISGCFQLCRTGD